MPTAMVLDEGSASVGVSSHDSVPASSGVTNYLFNVGFASGLELGGRFAQFGTWEGDANDLSFNAKYAYRFGNGLSLAVGAQDIGGEARNYRSRYTVATLPWRTLSFTVGHGWGPDVLEGPLGGIEWRPWPFVGAYAEYDGEEANPGLRVQTGPLWAGLRLGANVGYRGASEEVESGVQLTIPLGRRPSPARSASDLSPLPRGEVSDETQVPIQIQTQPIDGQASEASPALFAEGLSLRAALEELGFESVRTGTRGDGVLVVALENRRYNHAAADGIGLALGTIATRAPPSVERIELALSSYGVPQVNVATSAPAWREFLRSGTPEPELDVRYSDHAGREVHWHNGAANLNAAELVVEPLLRTFMATEYGMLDVGLGARARLTAPLSHGLVAHIGMQAPLLLTDDFRDGRNFEAIGPEAGLDLLLVQYVKKLSPNWTTLWSGGFTQVYQTDLRTAAVEQLWTSPLGRHRLNAKLMLLDSGVVRHEVALAGYTWFDATRRYSMTLTGGRFYFEDSGVRVDVHRYFDDTIVGLFLKAEAEDNMAGGFSISLPLTPRRDAAPRGLQVKGARRWSYALQTTLNLADGTNQLKPLLLYEPLTDFDLRRDFFDSNRLSPDWLRTQRPRMREAYLLWGD